MAVKLRLRRMGRRKRPIWSIVATDQRSARDGRHIEDLGRYYPLKQPALVEIDEERVLYWLEQGALPSDTVRSILSKQGLMLALHLRHKDASEEEVAEAVAAHREQRAEKDQEVKITSSDRRRRMLEAERERVAELEAEEAQKRKEAEAARKRQEEEERKRQEEERKRKEAEARAAEEAEEAEETETAEETEAAEAQEADAGEEAPEEAPEDAEEENAEAASDEAPPAAEEETAADESAPEAGEGSEADEEKQ